MKNTFFALLCATLMLCSCSSKDVRISGKFFGLNAKSVYLEQMTASGQTIIDSVALASDGSYRFLVKNVPSTPSIYNIIYNNERIPLLLTAGENVTVGSLGSVWANYTVSGSKESELLREFNREYVAGMQELNLQIAKYAEAGEASKAEIAKIYHRATRCRRRCAIRLHKESSIYFYNRDVTRREITIHYVFAHIELAVLQRPTCPQGKVYVCRKVTHIAIVTDLIFGVTRVVGSPVKQHCYVRNRVRRLRPPRTGIVIARTVTREFRKHVSHHAVLMYRTRNQTIVVASGYVDKVTL